MTESYRLETIADLIKIPPEKLSACLRDLEYALELAHLAGGEDAASMDLHGFVWTDDNNHSVDMTANGKPFLTLEVTGDDDGSR